MGHISAPFWEGSPPLSAEVTMKSQVARRKGRRMSGAQREMVFRGFDRWGWDERTYTENTCGQYSRIARQCDKWLLANRRRSIFSAGFQDFKAFMFAQKPTSRRRNHIRQALLAFLDYLVMEDHRSDNPLRTGGGDGKGLERLREPKSLPKAIEDPVALAVWVEAKTEHPMVTVAVGLFLWAGLRRDEARLLEWSRVDDEWITVDGKGGGRREGLGKERRIPIHPELAWALKRWRRECTDARWVFPSPRKEGRPVSKTWMREALNEIGLRLDIKLHPHLLRHTAATALLEGGADVRDVQDYLGHTDPKTTAIYLKVRPGRLRDAVQRMGFSGAERSEP